MSISLSILNIPGLLLNYHLDTIAYKNRILSAGGSITDNDLNAIDVFVKGINNNNLKSLLYEVYPFVGNNLTSALVKLYGNGTALTNNNFINSDYSRNTGITGNGTSKFINTNVLGNTVFTLTNAGYSIYNRSNTATNSTEIGMLNASNRGAVLYSNWSDNKTYFTCFDEVTSNMNAVIPVPTRTITVTVTSATDARIYCRGIQYGTTKTTTMTGAATGLPIYIFASNNNGITSNFSNKSLGFVSIHAGLNNTQVAILSNLIDILMKSLGRNV